MTAVSMGRVRPGASWEELLGPEDRLQRAVATYLDLLGVLWTHVPSEAKRSRWERWRAKIMGFKAGVPDVMIFEPSRNGRFVGLAIELKHRKNKTTAAQVEWLSRLYKKGWQTVVHSDFDIVKREIDAYLNAATYDRE